MMFKSSLYVQSGYATANSMYSISYKPTPPTHTHKEAHLSVLIYTLLNSSRWRKSSLRKHFPYTILYTLQLPYFIWERTYPPAPTLSAYTGRFSLSCLKPWWLLCLTKLQVDITEIVPTYLRYYNIVDSLNLVGAPNNTCFHYKLQYSLQYCV